MDTIRKLRLMKQEQAQPALAVEVSPGQTIRFRYRNWLGQIGTRTAQVVRLTYGVTEWHPEPQWLLEAVDTEKNQIRLFALNDMSPVDVADRGMAQIPPPSAIGLT